MIKDLTSLKAFLNVEQKQVLQDSVNCTILNIAKRRNYSIIWITHTCKITNFCNYTDNLTKLHKDLTWPNILKVGRVVSETGDVRNSYSLVFKIFRETF